MPKDQQLNDNELKVFAQVNQFDNAFRVSVKEKKNIKEAMSYIFIIKRYSKHN